MLRKTLLTVHVVVLAAYALPLLAVPVMFWGLYGIDVNAGTAVVIRILGGIVLGNAIFGWLAMDPDKASHILPVFAMEWGIMFIVSLQGQLAGLMNVLGWSNVIMAGLWVAILLYLRFAQSPARAAA